MASEATVHCELFTNNLTYLLIYAQVQLMCVSRELVMRKTSVCKTLLRSPMRWSHRSSSPPQQRLMDSPTRRTSSDFLNNTSAPHPTGSLAVYVDKVLLTLAGQSDVLGVCLEWCGHGLGVWSCPASLFL